MNWSERVVAVTGAGRGIGRGIVEHLVELGAAVYVLESDAESAERTRTALDASRVHSLVLDVSDETALAEAIEQILQRYGRLDGWVNNAGLAHPHSGPVEKLERSHWERVLEVNLTAPMLGAKHAVAHLRRREGAIVNIASTRALQSEPHSEAYAASKGGLVALTHALAISLGPDVRVNCISPGWIDTGSAESLSPKDHAQHPVGRVGNVQDIASLVAFLLSDEARFITGQNFVVDGGMSKKMIYVQ